MNFKRINRSKDILLKMLVMLCLLCSQAFNPAMAQEIAVNGKNVTIVDYGVDLSSIAGRFKQNGDGTWTDTNNAAKTDTVYQETGRDEWTVYLSGTAHLNLWKKEVVKDGKKIHSIVASYVVENAVTTIPAPPVNNIAKGKPATQSSNYNNGYLASIATDGIIDNTFTHTNQEAGAWWQVDLGVSHNISTITLSNRTNCCSERLNNFSILVSETPLTTNSGGAVFTDKQATFTGTKTFSGNAKGRYVRIFLNGTDYLSLAEVEIYAGQASTTSTSATTSTTKTKAPKDVGKIATGISTGIVKGGLKILDKTKIQDKSKNPMGSVGKVCKAIESASKGIKKVEGSIAKKLKAEQAAADDKFDKEMAQILYQAQKESGVSISDVDSKDLAVAMAKIKAEIHTTPPPVKEEWTAYDISKTTLEVAGLVDPIGVTSVVAAYVHPICGSKDAKLSSQASFCWKDSYGRGVGTVPKGCGPNQDRIGLLCYDKCPINKKRFGFDCHSVCPSGMRDDGLFCRASEYGRGVGYPWKLGDKAFSLNAARARCSKDNPQGCEKKGQIIYPNCKSGFKSFGSNICRPVKPNCNALGMNKGIDLSCAKKIEIGKPVTGVCEDGKQKDAGLCYNSCKVDTKGVGPVCWSGCSAKFPVNCGAGCGKTKLECGLAITDMVTEPLEMVASIATLGGYSLVDKAVDAAKKGAKKTTQKAGEKAAKKAAKELASETTESLAKKIGKPFIKKARQRLDDIKGATKRLTDTAKDVKKTIKDRVLDPVKDKLAKVAKENADKIKKGLKIDPNKIKSSALVDAEVILDRFKRVRKQIAKSNDLRAIKLVKQCATVGINIAKEWVPN